jgi:hypothetical protein
VSVVLLGGTFVLKNFVIRGCLASDSDLLCLEAFDS